MVVTVTTGNVLRSYSAASGREAVQMFFAEVQAGQIALSELGAIGEWADERESYPFRIVPALVKCGVITHSQALNLFKLAGLDFTTSQVAMMVSEDTWMVRASSDIQENQTVQ